MKNSLRIKLISPKMSLRPMDSEFKRRMSPSLSLVTIASLTPPPHTVFIEDENLNQLNLNDHPDLIGITVNVDTVYRAIEISAHYRQKGVSVVFGGIHVSAHPRSVLGFCDAVCVGEAEQLWPMMLEDFCLGKLKSIYECQDVTDLKLFPIPRWDYISKKDYLYHHIVVTSRGCPFKCEFCYNSCDYVKNKYRNRPLNHVMDEIKGLKSRQIMFIDDNLIGNITWFTSFLEALTPLKIIWHGAVSANLIRYPDLISKIALSGCRSLFIGFESINPDSIKSVGKSQNNISEYEHLIKTLHSHGIMVNASLVFGFDSDTKDCFKSTLKWLVKNKVETMTTHILTPYPGTVLYQRMQKENRIIDHDLQKYNTSHVVFLPKLMTPEELRKGYLNMYHEFYSLRNIFKRRPDHPKLLAPYFMFNFGYRKFGRFTSFIARIGLMERVGRWGTRLSYGLD